MVTMFREKALKVLFLIIILLPVMATAQESEAPPAPVSPIRAALVEAQGHVADGELDAAVGVLQGLADSGFTAVGVITGDRVLDSMAGHPGYDALVADMTVKAFPCEHDERFSEFDFWVGEWDVHIANGTFAGHNVIEKTQRGCVLIENIDINEPAAALAICCGAIIQPMRQPVIAYVLLTPLIKTVRAARSSRTVMKL